MILLQVLTSSVTKISEGQYQKNWEILLINGTSNIHLLLWNLPIQFIHWLNFLMLKVLRMKKFVLIIYHWKVILYHQIWIPKSYLLKLIIQILKSCLHKQLNRLIKINFNYGNTVFFVISQITSFQILFAKNAKVKTENGKLILDQNQRLKLSINTLEHTKIKFNQMNNLNPTL